MVELRHRLLGRRLKVSGLRAELVRRLEEDDEKNSDVPTRGDLDRHETDYVSKESAVSSPKAELPVAIQTLGIGLRNFRLENSDQYSDSETVQQLFQLVWYSRDIRPKNFGAKLRGKKSIKAERSYDLHLKTRATDLANDCSQNKYLRPI